jgi:hypothetical protein
MAMAWLATPTLIQARIYDAFGAPRTPIFEVTPEARDGTGLAMDVDDAGGFLLAWRASPGLVARRYLGDGSPATGPFVLASDPSTTDAFATFALHLGPDGSSLAAWSRQAAPTLPAALLVRAFDANGRPQGPESEVSSGPRFVNVALDVREASAVVAFGKKRPGPEGTDVVFDAWARRLDSLGALRSPEILVAQEAGFSHVPYGGRLFPDGRFALGLKRCDPVTGNGICSEAAIQWWAADGSSLPSLGVVLARRGPFLFPDTWLGSDPLGNFASLVVDTIGQSWAALNPLGAVVLQAEAPRPRSPGTTIPAGSQPVGFVPIGSSRFAVIWYDGDWAYLQAMGVLPESTPAPSFYTVEPCRLIDTRDAGAPLLSGDDRAVQASGRCAIPAGAKAVAANAVALEASTPGNLRFYRPDRLVPAASALNLGRGQTRASSTVIPLAADGALAARATLFGGTTHLIIDVSGYFQ